MKFGSPVGLQTTATVAGDVPVLNAPGTFLSTQTPEQLLATVAGGTSSVDVAIPAGAQSLVVIDPSGDGLELEVQGDQSGNGYVVIQTTVGSARWISQIDTGKDSSASVRFASGAPSAAWYVIASIAPSPLVYIGSEALSGASVGSSAMNVLIGGLDVSFLQRAAYIDTLRRLHFVPVPPGNGFNDHPSVELRTGKLTAQTAPATIIGAPGAGQRTRLFEVGIACMGGTGVVGCNWTDQLGLAGAIRAQAGFFLGGSRSFAPSGLALATDAAVTTTTGGTVTYDVYATYTVETV